MKPNSREAGLLHCFMEVLDEPSRLKRIAVAVGKNQIVIHPLRSSPQLLRELALGMLAQTLDDARWDDERPSTSLRLWLNEDQLLVDPLQLVANPEHAGFKIDVLPP